MKEIDWNINYHLNIDSLKEDTPYLGGDVDIFTDGSKIGEGSTGFGVVIKYKDKDTLKESGNLGLRATVFQGEIFAVSRAAQLLIDDNTQDRVIKMFVDSQPALKALVNPECHSKLVRETRAKFKDLAHYNDIELRWVKAHIGHALNEEADRLAKLGTESKNLFNLPIPIKAVKTEIAEQYTCLLYTSPSPRD